MISVRDKRNIINNSLIESNLTESLKLCTNDECIKIISAVTFESCKCITDNCEEHFSYDGTVCQLCEWKFCSICASNATFKCDKCSKNFCKICFIENLEALPCYRLGHLLNK